MSRTINMLAGEPQEFYEVSNFFRILESSGPLSVEFYFQGREVAEALNVTEGYAEKFEIGQFDRVRLVSPTNQTVQFVQRLGNSVLYDKAPVGDSNIVGGVMLTDAQLRAAAVPVALDLPSLNSLLRPVLPTNHWKNSSGLAANAPMTVFTPAANPNGAIVWHMEANDQSSSTQVQVFIGKAGAPTDVSDGEVLAQSVVVARADNINFCALRRERPVRLAAGLGLYFISSGAGAAWFRNCRYTLL